MTPGRFRLLLVIYAGIYLVAIAAALLPVLIGLAEGSLPWIFTQPLHSAALLAGLTVVVAAPVGLYGFKPWARPLSLVVTVLILPLAYFPEESSSGLDVVVSALLELASLLWGGILALSYCSPIANHFGPDSVPLARRAS